MCILNLPILRKACFFISKKFEDGRDFDWDDLSQLLNRAVDIDRERITTDCVSGFRFLADLTDDERALAGDRYQREQVVAEKVREGR